MSTFEGFPVCEASVKTHGDMQGYGSIYGWIQMVRAGDPSDSTTPWEMDPIPILADLNTPFAWFGPEPKLFDAPTREGVDQLDWTCHSFLTYIEDSLVSKAVIPILGFQWGFELHGHGSKPKIKVLRELQLDAWNGHLDLLENSFSGWSFSRYQGEEIAS